MIPELSMYAREHHKTTEIRDAKLDKVGLLIELENCWDYPDVNLSEGDYLSDWAKDEEGNDRLAKDHLDLNLQLYAMMAWIRKPITLLNAEGLTSPYLDLRYREAAMYQPTHPHWIGALVYPVIRASLLPYKRNPR